MRKFQAEATLYRIVLLFVGVLFLVGCNETTKERPNPALLNENEVLRNDIATLKSDIVSLKLSIAEQQDKADLLRQENEVLRKGKGHYVVSTWLLVGASVIILSIGFALGVKVKHETINE